MPSIEVDGKRHSFEGEGRNLLDVCLSLGLDLPYFCWHPAMHSVGACRQCAVRQLHDDRAEIVMACMTPARDGTRISISDPEAVEFRRSIIEWLMANHPHDCPVCDEGGECHLQDMTVLVGHVYRRQRFPKRTFRSQYLGPLVAHEMNRCVECYRCVRFYQEVAGGDDLDVFGWHDHVYFGRVADGALESEFAGNLVELCPTGVFTDQTQRRHYTRLWDLQTAPSVCVHCSLGCNTIPGERYGTLRRIRARYHPRVNGYFLCDRGRYGYEFVNSPRRVRAPLARGDDGTLHPITRQQALARLGERLPTARLIGIGSPRASLETNFALRALVGADRFFAGVSDTDHGLMQTIAKVLKAEPSPAGGLQDLAEADAVLVLGQDVTNTAPLTALSLRRSIYQRAIGLAQAFGIPPFQDAAVREAIQQETGPLFIATPDATKVDDVAQEIYRGAPDDIARLGCAVAHRIDPAAPAPLELATEDDALAGRIAEQLLAGARPHVVTGHGCGSVSVVEAAANVAWALRRKGRRAGLSCFGPECNSLGLALMGAGGLTDAARHMAEGGADALVVAENDLFRRLEGPEAERLLESAGYVAVLDHVLTPTAERADLVLPVGTFAEATGTLVNAEGRAQRFFQVFEPGDDIQATWRWCADLLSLRTGGPAPWHTVDEVLQAMAAELPVFREAPRAAPDATYRRHGRRVPRQSHRFSGRAAIHAAADVHEPVPPVDVDSPLAFSMEGTSEPPPAALVPRFWSPGWNSVQAVTKFQGELEGVAGGLGSGVLLLPQQATDAAPYHEAPPPFRVREDEWLAIPGYHTFGSEELSRLSPGIAELTPAPYVGMCPADIERFDLSEGQEVGVRLGHRVYILPVRPRPKLACGCVAVPVGLEGLEGIALPARAALLVTGISYPDSG